MTEATHSPEPTADETEDGMPIIQQILDNPILLLFLGIATPAVLYIAWRVMEIAVIPAGK